MWLHPQVGPLLAGPVYVVLTCFLAAYEAGVERIGRYSGSYNLRRIARSTKWSNHASGTAVDINWKDHPVGTKYGGFTAEQKATVLGLLKLFPVLRWGGPAFNDPMHFEIAPAASRKAVERLAVELLQGALIRRGYDLGKSGADGVRGKLTDAALKAFQEDNGLTPDGVDGPETWKRLLAPLPEGDQA